MMLAPSHPCRWFAVFTTLAAIAVGSSGCSADPQSTEDAVESDEALTAPCTLGATCPATLGLLDAKSAPTRLAGAFRSDVTVDATTGAPREVRRKTSRALRFDGSKRVTLSADAAGTGRVAVQGLLLVEILDAAARDLLSAGVVSASAPVHVAGKAATNLGAEGDLSALLPVDRPFVLRVSALAFSAPASTSDVFLTLSKPAPPPPPLSPFDPDFCQGPALAPADVHFAELGAVGYIKARQRTCATCAWQELGVKDLALHSGAGDALLGEIDPIARLVANPAPALVIEDTYFKHEYCSGDYPRSCYIPSLAFRAALDVTSGNASASIGNVPPSAPTVSDAAAALSGVTTARLTRSCYQIATSWRSFARETEVVIGGTLPPK